MTYQEQRKLRDMINEQLNRISVTNDREEVIKMLGFLQMNISKYANYNLERIREETLSELNEQREKILAELTK